MSLILWLENSISFGRKSVMGNFELSICVVTMNRANQLKDALESCINCNLPQNTEFVIIDNASTDNTQEITFKVLENSGYRFYYEKLPENLGVGGGRNYAFKKCSGKYIYVLDDDAVVSTENVDFFTMAIEYFNKYDDIVTLTTQIYDTALEDNRLSIVGKIIYDGLYPCKMFCGGSHFLRKEFFEEPPYFNNKYGYEEIPPSLYVADAGKKNVFCPELLIIHKPTIDKWDKTKKENIDILINDCATVYALKKMLYPCVFSLLLSFAYHKRCKLYLKDRDSKKQADKLAKNILRKYPKMKKIKITTVVEEYKKFGLSVF